MSFVYKESSRKIKTQTSLYQSLPKLRVLSSKQGFNIRNQTGIIREHGQFPSKWRNPSMILKKAAINLDVAKRIPIIRKQELHCSPKKILPHPIHLRRSLIKFTDPSIQKKKVLNDDNIVHITAQKWLIYDFQKSQPIKGYKYKKQHDISGITKILTFYTAYAIIKQYKISIDKTDLIVMKQDQEIQGRKINFQNQNVLTLEDCLYAMLLYGANNGATVLANNLGYLCQKRRQNTYFSCFDINRKNRTKNINFFVSLMQIFASKLDLIDTHISNPHGFSKNYSNAKDIAKLFEACWEIPLFQKIMTSKQRQIQMKYVNSEGNLCLNKVNINNFNQIQKLSKNFKAGKTGQNSQGGHNLVSYFQNPLTNKKYIIVVLGSYGKEDKLKDTQLLYQWGESLSK